MFYHILNIKITSQSLSNFCIELPATGDVTGHRLSWNKCFIIYRMNTAQYDAACRNNSQVVRLKIHLLQHLLVLQSWYNITTVAT